VSQLPKRFLLLLAASLALNLFFIGAITARVVMRDRRPELGARAFLHHSGLDHASKDVQKLVHKNRGAVRERMHELSDARKQARAALQAEPFDPAQLDAAFERVRTRTVEMQQEMHKSFSEVAGKLDREQRKRMAEALWRRPGQGGTPPLL
jgi:uncharacterized membrane protein